MHVRMIILSQCQHAFIANHKANKFYFIFNLIKNLTNNFSWLTYVSCILFIFVCFDYNFFIQTINLAINKMWKNKKGVGLNYET